MNPSEVSDLRLRNGMGFMWVGSLCVGIRTAGDREHAVLVNGTWFPSRRDDGLTQGRADRGVVGNADGTVSRP